jgi:hypothetical protein
VIDFISKRFLVLGGKFVDGIKVVRLLGDQSSLFECLDGVLQTVLGSESFYSTVKCVLRNTVEDIYQLRSISGSAVFEILMVRSLEAIVDS